MSDLRQAAQQALEALETRGEHHPRVYAAITALKAALAEPPVDDPHRDHWVAIAEAAQKIAASKECGLMEAKALCAALDRLPDAALAEPAQEPVAWRWGYRSVTTGEMDWRGYVEIAAHPNLRSPAIIMEPLYTAPPQRKPLTEE